MKRKIWVTVAAAALVAAMCVSFAACGGNAKNVKGEEVTEEVWKAAFAAENFENFQCVYTSEMVARADGKEGKANESATYVVADKKEHVSYSGSNSGELAEEADEKSYTAEAYYDYSGLVTVSYAKNDDGKWEKGVSLSEALGLYRGQVLTWIALSAAYNAFEYSGEKAGYVLKTGGLDPAVQQVVSSLAGTVIKIKGGKLAAIYSLQESTQEESGDYGKYEYGYVFSYGGQSVTLPEVSE